MNVQSAANKPLSKPGSPAAQRIIKEAFKDLKQTISHNDSAEFSTTTLEKVVQAAHDIENQLAARQSLRNMRRLTPLFDGLHYYSKSIEVACNGTPYMPWIWAPITLILKVASDYVEAFDKLIGAYARIAEPLSRFKLWTETYYQSIDLQEALAMFYSDILKFHKEAYKFVRRSGWKVFFMTSWGRFQRRFDGIIQNLKDHERLVDDTANAVAHSVALSEIKRMSKEANTRRQEAFQKAEQEDEDRTTTQYLQIISWLNFDINAQGKALAAVTAEPHKYPETCDWILRQKRISSWMKCNSETPLLVVHGHTGTGKSVLMAQIATFLESSGSSLVISHICANSQPASAEYDQILRSILLQLVHRDNNLVAYVHEQFLTKRKTVTAQAMERIIREVIGAVSDNPSQIRYVHVIFDGLDECAKDKQVKIANLLERLVSESFVSGSTICKVLVSSRMPEGVANKLRQKHTVSLSDEKAALEKAIASYASHRLAELQTNMHFNRSELEALELQLAKKADGMFLWARIVLDYIVNNLFFRKHEVMDAISQLPRELSEIYGKILAQMLSHLDERSISRLRSILGWVAFAKRPLRKAELRSALSSLSEADSVNIEELAPDYIFDKCKPLVEEQADTTFAFIHVSVKEYLMSPASNLPLDHLSQSYEQGLATACCLLSGLQTFNKSCQEQIRYQRMVRGFHGLHLYASQYWVEYLLSIAVSENGIDKDSAFFSRSSELSISLNTLRRGEAPLTKLEGVGGSRLANLQSSPELWNAARAIISDGLVNTEATARPATGLVDITNLSTLLMNYQYTARELLGLFRLTTISAQELERFKENFRSAAFTCRFGNCPFASEGFDNEAIRNDHEKSHVLSIPCEIGGCQYPPFNSTSALKNHQAKHHAVGIPKFKIRFHAKGDRDGSMRNTISRQVDQNENQTHQKTTSQTDTEIIEEKPGSKSQGTSDGIYETLRRIGQEEQKAMMTESIADIPMSPEERAETAKMLIRLVHDMGKIGKALARWYGAAHDDQRARAYFRARILMIRQFEDGETMLNPKTVFSIRPAEINEIRRLLETMARDCASKGKGKTTSKVDAAKNEQHNETVQ